MKKYSVLFIVMLLSLICRAQEASVQPASAPAEGGIYSVNTMYVFMIALLAALFLVIIIYALARAVKSLSSQVKS